MFFILFLMLNAMDLSLEKAIELALINSESLKISELEYNKSLEQYKEVKSSIYPKVTGSIDWYNYVLPPVIRMDMPPELGGNTIEAKVKKPYEMTYGVTLSQVVWTFGKLGSAIELAKDYKEAQNQIKEITKYDITLAVKNLYYSTLFTYKLKLIAEESHKNALKNQKTLKESFGRISRFDNLKMSSDISNRVVLLNNSNKNYENVLINLKSFLNLDSNIALTDKFIEDFPKYNIADLKNNLEANEPNLKALKSAIEINKSLLNLKEADYYPSLGSFLNYSYTGNSNQAFIGDTYLRNNFTVGLSLSGNIFDSGETRSRINQAKYEYNIAKLNYELQRKNLFTQLESIYSDYINLIKTYKANKDYQSLSSQTYEASISSFIAGKLTQMQLNDIELMLTGSKIQSLETLYNINLAIAKIDRLSNF